MTEFGTSGSYILGGVDKKPIAIFKPVDEEPFAPHNPKGYVGKYGQQGLINGILSGEGAVREYAAHVICPELVPPTLLVEFSHSIWLNKKKNGSL